MPTERRLRHPVQLGHPQETRADSTPFSNTCPDALVGVELGAVGAANRRSVFTKPLEFNGGPAGNRTRMTGLEDRCFVH